VNPRRLAAVVAVLLRDARRHRLQTVTTLLGIAVGTAVVVAIHLASEAAQQSFARNMADFTGRATHQLRAAGPLPAGRLAELLAAPGVTAVAPVIETTLVTLPDTQAAPPPGSTARAARRAAAQGPGAPRALRLLGLDPFFARPFLPEPPAERDAAPQSGELLTRLLTEPGLALAPQTLLDELELLHNACRILRMHCVTGIKANPERCRQFVESTTATVTALVEELGYDKAEALAKESRATGKSLRQLAEEKYGIPGKRFDELVSPEAVNRLGSPEEGVERPRGQGGK